jgi:hypothetical protein
MIPLIWFVDADTYASKIILHERPIADCTCLRICSRYVQSPLYGPGPELRAAGFLREAGAGYEPIAAGPASSARRKSRSQQQQLKGCGKA